MDTANKSKKILLVEDELSLQHAITKKLESSGFEVLTARSVEGARKQLSITRVDAIWLDHYLIGDQSGLEYATELKSNDSAYKDIPVFVVSNTASPDKMDAYIALGVDRYYTKTNYRLEDIISDIQNLVGISV